jgi:hypothetical protein
MRSTPPDMSTHASPGQQTEGYALGLAEFVPWDLTYKPTKNLYLDKVGVLGTTRAIAVDKVSEQTLIRKYIEGYEEGDPAPAAEAGSSSLEPQSAKPPAKIDTRRPLEPDNWVLRLHQSRGLKNLSTWALRLIADNSNKSSEMENRGSMVIDQGDKQLWDFLQNLLQLTDMKTPVSSDELAFHGAGFLGLLYPDPAASGAVKTRGALALCVHRNKGHATDGGSVGMLSHLVTFQAPKKSVATEGGGKSKRPGGPGDTVTAENPDPRKATSQPSKEDELLLRADGGIYFGPGKVGRWLDEPDGKPEKGNDADERRLVLLFLHDPAPPDDKLDTAVDDNTNHKQLPKSVGKQVIHGVVRIPKPGSGYHHDEHHDDSYHHPPPQDGEGSGASPSPTDYGENPPDSDGENPDESEPTPDEYDPDDNPVPTVDDRDAAFTGGSRQCQHGHCAPESPGFSQRFNVHEGDQGDYTVGAMMRTKPEGYRNIRIKMELRVSDAISLGEEIELEVLVIPFSTTSPTLVYSQSVRFDSTVDPSLWITRERVFKGFADEKQKLTILFVRRNDIASNAAAVELWRLSAVAVWE